MEIFKNIATVVGCISACLALAVTIVKPLRQWVIDSFVQKSQQTNLQTNIEDLNKKIDLLIQSNEQTQNKIKKIEEHMLENESDRLKSELSMYYNRCCRSLQIFPEEMLRVEEVYDRYHNKLGLNHIGTNMYDAIEKYYKQQDFIKMHKN